MPLFGHKDKHEARGGCSFLKQEQRASERVTTERKFEKQSDAKEEQQGQIELVEIEKTCRLPPIYNPTLRLVHILAAVRKVIWLSLRGSSAVSSRNPSPWRTCRSFACQNAGIRLECRQRLLLSIRAPIVGRRQQHCCLFSLPTAFFCVELSPHNQRVVCAKTGFRQQSPESCLDIQLSEPRLRRSSAAVYGLPPEQTFCPSILRTS